MIIIHTVVDNVCSLVYIISAQYEFFMYKLTCSFAKSIQALGNVELAYCATG